MCSVVYKRKVTCFEVCFMCVCVWAVKSKQLLDIWCLHIYFDHLMIKWNANPWFQTKMQMTTCLCPSPPQSPWPRSQLLPNLRRPREPKKVSPVWVCTMCPTRVLCTMRSSQVSCTMRSAQIHMQALLQQHGAGVHTCWPSFCLPAFSFSDIGVSLRSQKIKLTDTMSLAGLQKYWNMCWPSVLHLAVLSLFHSLSLSRARTPAWQVFNQT